MTRARASSRDRQAPTGPRIPGLQQIDLPTPADPPELPPTPDRFGWVQGLLMLTVLNGRGELSLVTANAVGVTIAVCLSRCPWLLHSGEGLWDLWSYALSGSGAALDVPLAAICIVGLLGFVLSQAVLFFYDRPPWRWRRLLWKIVLTIYVAIGALPWSVHCFLGGSARKYLMLLDMGLLLMASVAYAVVVHFECENLMNKALERDPDPERWPLLTALEAGAGRAFRAGSASVAAVATIGSKAFALSVLSGLPLLCRLPVLPQPAQ